MDDVAPPPPPLVAEPKYTVSVEYTDDFLMKHFRKRYIKRFSFFLAAGLVMFLGLSWNHDATYTYETFQVPLAGFMFIVIFLVVRFKSAYRNAHAIILKMESRLFQFDFDDSGVTQTISLGSTKLRWDMFTKLERRKDIWRLYTTNRVAWLLPATAMSPELQEFICRKFAEAGKKIK